MCVRDAMFTHRAEQHSHKLSMPSAPNDKKVCSPGGFYQCRGWMALSDLGLDGDAWVRVPHRVDRFGQHFSGVGTWVPVRDVWRRPPVTHWPLPGCDDFEQGARELCLQSRPIQGMCRRFRTIDTNDDAMLHLYAHSNESYTRTVCCT